MHYNEFPIFSPSTAKNLHLHIGHVHYQSGLIRLLMAFPLNNLKQSKITMSSVVFRPNEIFSIYFQCRTFLYLFIHQIIHCIIMKRHSIVFDKVGKHASRQT